MAFRVIIKNYLIKTAQQSRSNSTVKFTVQNYKLHRLEEGPNIDVELNKEDALKMYHHMTSIRRMETNVGNLYTSKHVRGFCHLYNGQEACAVGMFVSMRPADTAISAYRVHGWNYLMSMGNIVGVIAELVGTAKGLSKGKGGSMHIYSHNFYGGNGIVGAQVPLGAGLALAAKYEERGGVTMCMYGDGASNQGQVFETYNMAKLWDLPCIFVCENNQYGMGTSNDRSSSNTLYYTKGDYIPGIWVDGMDVLAVREATRFAIEYCTSGKGPLVIELLTYRYYGHSMSDPGTSYRTREEVQNVRSTRDPIRTFLTKITESNLVTEAEIKAIDAEVKKTQESAMKEAMKDDELSLDNLTTDIYKVSYEPSIRGVTPFEWWPHQNKEPPK